MATVIDSIIQSQLFDRREKLEKNIARRGEDKELRQLLFEVDAALARVENGSFGICKSCQGEIEPERLLADPMLQFCLDDLTPQQQQSLEKDLALAALIQKSLLPKLNMELTGWRISYRYEPIGLVSGDYCDLVKLADGGFYFMLGDVSGKGVAASMLMTQLHALFRSLISVNLPLAQLVERVSSIFCESTMPMHFATLVCGKVAHNGAVELCNAGHLPPLLIRGNNLIEIEATGLPIGMFNNEHFTVKNFELGANDMLLIFTDGLTEAENLAGDEYGKDRLSQIAIKQDCSAVDELINSIMKDLATFQVGQQLSDDLTIMAISRAG
jgi:phosphoserine phosphatase RsbU/P